MNILIDIQGCQTESRHRGIGRYSLSLAKAIIRNRGSHQIKILANGSFGNDLAALKAQFCSEIGEQNFIVFDADFPVAEIDPANATRARLAEIAREHLIAELNPDIVLLTSLFEGFLDNAVTSVGRAGKKPLTAITLYDLIPYLRPDPNWPPHYPPYYDRKIASLKQADLLLSISDYARRESTEAIPELGPKIFNMSSACESKIFYPAKVSSARRDELSNRYGIRDLFIMSTGNIDERKNFEQILHAFGTLPNDLRTGRQVVLVGESADSTVLDRLWKIATSQGLGASDFLVLTRIPDEDLVDLYRLCELFVFPSKHEGFGLPPLEAISCGAAVIGSNTSSVPEVIGRADAQFDPHSVEGLSVLMHKALTEADFMASLRSEGLKRASLFSWDKTAQAALHAMSKLVEQHLPTLSAPSVLQTAKPKLAVFCPLPPEQTGIADYMAELLPALSKRYDVTMITDQTEVTPIRAGAFFQVKTIAWFEENSFSFQRVLYQIGNSPFHVHMLDLMVRYPGVVVLHDFFLSSLMAWMQESGYDQDAFKRSLLYGHGYRGLYDLEIDGLHAAKIKWPCSFEVVSGALGLLLHSQHSRDLIGRYYGHEFNQKIRIARHQRLIPDHIDRASARARLGFTDDCFVVCAFGFIDETKLNHRLLHAWAESSLVKDKNCHLVFVGGEGPPDYHEQITQFISAIDKNKRIKITGFASRAVFEDYLMAADVAVQLRGLSRGETSGTVLDCLAYGVPLILNAHGSMQEYRDDVLFKLDDTFENKDLVEALERLRNDPDLRCELSKSGVEYIRSTHAPEQTVEIYAELIEQVAARKDNQLISSAINNFWKMLPPKTQPERALLAQKLLPLVMPEHRPVLYVDLSATVRNDLKTGIERVARALLYELLINPPAGYDVVPVYLIEEAGHWHVRRAARYLSQIPGFSLAPAEDETVIPNRGDVLIALDLFTDGVVRAHQQGLYNYWHQAGARIGFMVHDILPVTHPEFFPPWAMGMHGEWMKTISVAADFLVSVSEHVRTELLKWLDKTGRTSGPVITASHHGADLAASYPSSGLPDDAHRVIAHLTKRPTFLMVGTIEPRKGHLLVLKAFERLWQEGIDINLVVVGNEGWKPLQDHDRRSIPEIVKKMRDLRESADRFFWLEGASDEYLTKIYEASICLVFASEDEGFGLPLIEAAQHKLPIIVRDIPVFHEVAGEHAYYFDGCGAEGLVDALKSWLLLYKQGCHPKSDHLPWLTWKTSAARLAAICVGD